jgi:Zinc knuckle
VYSKVPEAALATVQELQEKNMRGQFLMKLRSEFEPIHRQLMARSPIPSLTECFRELQHEEQRMRTRSSFEEQKMGVDASNLAFLARGKYNPRDMSGIQCFSCKEYGHIAKDCKKKFCNYCKKDVHIISECRPRPQKRHTALQAIAEESSPIQSS